MVSLVSNEENEENERWCEKEPRKMGRLEQKKDYGFREGWKLCKRKHMRKTRDGRKRS